MLIVISDYHKFGHAHLSKNSKTNELIHHGVTGHSLVMLDGTGFPFVFFWIENWLIQIQCTKYPIQINFRATSIMRSFNQVFCENRISLSSCLRKYISLCSQYTSSTSIWVASGCLFALLYSKTNVKWRTNCGCVFPSVAMRKANSFSWHLYLCTQLCRWMDQNAVTIPSRSP